MTINSNTGLSYCIINNKSYRAVDFSKTFYIVLEHNNFNDNICFYVHTKIYSFVMKVFEEQKLKFYTGQLGTVECLSNELTFQIAEEYSNKLEVGRL